LSLKDVLSQAVQQTASLSWVDIAVSTPSQEEQIAHDIVKLRWLDAVKDMVAGRNIELLPFFDQEGILVENGQPVKFGFLGRSVVAHFGVMRLGDSRSAIKMPEADYGNLGRPKKERALSMQA